MNTSIQVSEDNSQIRFNHDQAQWLLRAQHDERSTTLTGLEGQAPCSQQTALLLDQLFHSLNTPTLTLAPELADLFDTSHPAWQHQEGQIRISRQAFYQIRENWLDTALLRVIPEEQETTSDSPHPRRPRIGDQVLYRRFVPAMGKTVTLRQAHPAVDGERFHRWQNTPRIAQFWEYPFSRERLDAMLEERRQDPHSLPLILEADGEAVGYFEAYYVTEDRLGPYCQAGPFDQGFHVLVGEDQFLGGGQTPIWLNSVCHFLFLTEPRTRCLYGEPRADNSAMLRHLETTSWEHHGEFDFPHKRSALVCNQRRDFFQQTRL